MGVGKYSIEYFLLLNRIKDIKVVWIGCMDR